MIRAARKGKRLYVRPIAGIEEIDNAIGRATEMGRPILYVPGISGIRDVATIAGLAILGKIARKAAEYDTKILVPVRDFIVLPIAQEIIKEAHYEAGRPDTYDKNSAFFYLYCTICLCCWCKWNYGQRKNSNKLLYGYVLC